MIIFSIINSNCSCTSHIAVIPVRDYIIFINFLSQTIKNVLQASRDDIIMKVFLSKRREQIVLQDRKRKDIRTSIFPGTLRITNT